LITTDRAYSAMLLVCGVGILVDALERLTSVRKYRDDGFYSWTLARQRLALWPTRARAIADWLFMGVWRLALVLVVRILALGIVVASPLGGRASAAGLTVLLATQGYISLRTGGMGLIGADPMTFIVCGSALLGTAVARTPQSARAGLWFVALQACLGYVVAGVAKLAAPKWRSGRALVVVLSTYTYGSPKLHGYLRARPNLVLAMCWAVMLWETSFPLVLVLPPAAACGLLGLGILFHLQIAALMGLNLFVFAYPATYAAILAVRG
jgi:hypothetical protein